MQRRHGPKSPKFGFGNGERLGARQKSRTPTVVTVVGSIRDQSAMSFNNAHGVWGDVLLHSV